MSTTADPDPAETREWLEALDAVMAHDGPERAEDLLARLIAEARASGASPAVARAGWPEQR